MDKQVENLILDSITELRKDVSEIKSTTAVIKSELEQQKNDTIKVIEQLKKDSFPNGDTGGHKVFHENVMEERKNSVDIKKEVTTHLIKGAFWAIVVGIFYASVTTIKEWMNK